MFKIIQINERMGKRMKIEKKERKSKYEKNANQESNDEAFIISVFAILLLFLVFLAVLMPNFLLMFDIFMFIIIGMTIAIIIEHMKYLTKEEKRKNKERKN